MRRLGFRECDHVASLPEPVGVSMNCWRFDERIFAACQAIEPSSRGELEVTDAVQYAIDTLGAVLKDRDDIEQVGDSLAYVLGHE